MQTHIGHLQFNVNGANIAFYRDLMAFLGWQTLYDGPVAENVPMLGVGGAGGASVWFSGGAKPVKNDYDGPGLNHFGIGVARIADVDATVTFVKSKGIATLFDTPRHRPDFASSENDTYYQVMFESPDHILFEVVYVGPK